MQVFPVQQILAGESVSRILKTTKQIHNLFGINAKIYVHNICGRLFVRQVQFSDMFLTCFEISLPPTPAQMTSKATAYLIGTTTLFALICSTCRGKINDVEPR